MLAQAAPQPELVHFLPIGTTLTAIVFLAVLLKRAEFRKWPPHLMWWAAGVFTYGLGTLLESMITLGGNSVFLNKAWYIAGALLGGYPLAQGSVYLHLSRRWAHALTAVTVPFIIVVAALVAISPVNAEAMAANPHRPTGEMLGWSDLRLTTPFINLYAVVFLVGGAIYSAVKFAVAGDSRGRAIGNSLIAFGAILPGIGGALTKRDMVEALYIGEFLGILFIWAGYTACVRSPAPRTTPASKPVDATGSAEGASNAAPARA